jgi:hypothetical protein
MFGDSVGKVEAVLTTLLVREGDICCGEIDRD